MALALVGCATQGTWDEPEEPEIIGQPVIAPIPQPQLRIIGGNHQVGIGGTILDRPLVVRLVDADGRPMAYVPVDFKVVGKWAGNLAWELYPNGEDPILRPRMPRTDSEGRAKAYYAGSDFSTDDGIIVASAMGSEVRFVERVRPEDSTVAVTDVWHFPTMVLGETKLTWTNNPKKVDYILVQQQLQLGLNSMAWRTIARLADTKVTSYTAIGPPGSSYRYRIVTGKGEKVGISSAQPN